MPDDQSFEIIDEIDDKETKIIELEKKLQETEMKDACCCLTGIFQVMREFTSGAWQKLSERKAISLIYPLKAKLNLFLTNLNIIFT